MGGLESADIRSGAEVHCYAEATWVFETIWQSSEPALLVSLPSSDGRTDVSSRDGGLRCRQWQIATEDLQLRSARAEAAPRAASSVQRLGLAAARACAAVVAALQRRDAPASQPSPLAVRTQGAVQTVSPCAGSWSTGAAAVWGALRTAALEQHALRVEGHDAAAALPAVSEGTQTWPARGSLLDGACWQVPR